MRKKNAGSAKEPDSIYGSEEGHAGRVSGVFFEKETVKKITIFSPPVFLIKRGKVLGAFLQEGTMPIKIIKTLFVFPKSFFVAFIFSYASSFMQLTLPVSKPFMVFSSFKI